MDSTTAAFRFGLGLPLPPGAAADPAALRAALIGPDLAAATYPGRRLDDVLPVYRTVEHTARLVRQAKMASDDPAHLAARKASADLAQRAVRVTLARAVDAADGLRERLVWFWADHFTVRARNNLHRYLPATLVEDAIRPHITGRFADMLVAVTLHPAMLIYLDQAQSTGPGSPVGLRTGAGLNENLARELIELHTLGVGAAYSQTDVRELAELLTGLGFNPEEGFVFQPGRVEPGVERVLGRAYGGGGTAPILQVLDDLAARPETAAHLARKLAVHFVADAPAPDLVDDLAQAFTDSGGNLLRVTEVLIGHPAAGVPDAAKARQPLEFIVAALRALGVQGREVMAMDELALRRMILQPLQTMGQPWQEPRGPDGWPEAAEAWITPQGLAARIHWAMSVPQRLVTALPEPDALAERALGARANATVRRAAARAETRREGVGLVLAAPAFNRR